MSEPFGNYLLIEKVAAGGMAEIFRAVSTHGQGVQKTVCIKRIHPALSSDAVFVAMFIEEARLGVSMVHGNIVPVFDFGCVDGRYYLAMEWVDGLDLAALEGRSRVVGIPWPLELAVHVVIEVLEGLAYAHQKRDDRGRPLELVHRDVSPSNILLSLDGQVKLLDFGIARSQAREFETRTGVIKGKPGYMSPEQARGGAVDARADVWSCGAVLYELATGRRLGDEHCAIGDPELDSIARRALDVDAGRRYFSARELQNALISWLDARGEKPRARDIAGFIDRVQRASAPGKNWDMSSAAVEQHLAAAIEAAQRDFAKPITEDVDRPATVRIDDDSSPKERSVVTEKAAPRRRRLAAAALGALAIGAAVLAVLRFGAEREGDHPADAVRSFAAAQEIQVSDAGDAATTMIPTQASQAPDEDAGAVRASAADVEVPQLLRAREGSTRPMKSPKKAFLSVNTIPWSNIVLDGRPLGQTPIQIDAPREIAPGKHMLVLTNPISGATRTLEITVSPGEHKIVREKL